MQWSAKDIGARHRSRDWSRRFARPDRRLSRVRDGHDCPGGGAERPGLRAAWDQDDCFEGFWEMARRAPMAPAQGTRASANTSGPDFTEAKSAGEIADPWGSAPNEENLFLLPDRLRKRTSPSEVRSSRLTWCLADTLFRRPEPSDL